MQCPDPFAFALDNLYAAGVLCDFFLDYRCGTIGRIVIDDKYVESDRESEHGIDDCRGILALVVHRYYYGSIAAWDSF